MSEKNRAELVLELEQLFRGKRVFAIVYSRDESCPGFIRPGDEYWFRHFIDEVLKKENVPECVIILNGPGGNVKTAILCSQMLRESLIRYDTLVPTALGSSLCYFVLQSDRLLLSEKSLLTQIDPVFDYEGNELRAKEHLNDSNSVIRDMAHNVFNSTRDHIQRVLKTTPHVFEKEVSQNSQTKLRFLGKMVDFWMGKEAHEKTIAFHELKDLKVKHKKVDDEILEKAKILVDECLKELKSENMRFVIQTSRIEENRFFGGFFYL